MHNKLAETPIFSAFFRPAFISFFAKLLWQMHFMQTSFAGICVGHKESSHLRWVPPYDKLYYFQTDFHINTKQKQVIKMPKISAFQLIYCALFSDQKHVFSDDKSTEWWACFCSISRPSRSHSSCCFVISLTSSLFLGHWNFIPSSNFFVASTNPFLSYLSTLMAFLLLLQKIKT